MPEMKHESAHGLSWKMRIVTALVPLYLPPSRPRRQDQTSWATSKNSFIASPAQSAKQTYQFTYHSLSDRIYLSTSTYQATHLLIPTDSKKPPDRKTQRYNEAHSHLGIAVRRAHQLNNFDPIQLDSKKIEDITKGACLLLKRAATPPSLPLVATSH